MKKVPLTEYFDIIAPIQDDKINFTQAEKRKKNGIPFLGRSAANNGIVGYVEKRPGFVNEGNVITIALDGSTGATFYQYHNFSSGQNIWILKQKEKYLKEMTPEIAMFIITSIRKAVEGYTWNLSLTKTRLQNIKIYLPVTGEGSVDTDYIHKRMSGIRNISFIKNIQKERMD